MRNSRTFLLSWFFAVLLAGWSTTTYAAPEVGWYWNPNESGRGFFIESANGIVYLAAYSYEDNGRATWLVAGGPNNDPYNYSGRLLSFRSGQTLFGEYQPPQGPADVGAVSFHFSDDTHASLTLAGITIPIERQMFGGSAFPAQPDAGWWWNPDESGRGYSIEVQGKNLFLVGFMYDDTGNPVWYFSAGPMDSPTTYKGSILQFAGGQTLGGTYKPPADPVTIGQLNVEFTAIDEATLTFNDATAGQARSGGQANPVTTAGKRKTTPIKREFPTSPSFKPAERYGGTMTISTDFIVRGPSATLYATASVSADISWIAGELGVLPSADFRAPINTYDLGPGQATATFDFSLANAVDGSHCEGSTSIDVSLGSGSFLAVNGYGQFQGALVPQAKGNIEAGCSLSDGSHPTVPIPVSLILPALPYSFGGKVGYDDATARQVIAGKTKYLDDFTLSWKFVGKSSP